ncbi:MAG: nucleotidyltransferase domain-containing protein [Bacteroidia bacterium]|nr:nucleotidyltransferase domain-containing protein [Bacteroidia bacterium]
MLTKKTAIRIVKEFIYACAERNIIFNKVFIFGSVVTNKAHRYSDIDVALISDRFSGMPFKDWSILTPIKSSNRAFIDIEPHPFSTDYFEKGDPFIDEIKRTGIEII